MSWRVPLGLRDLLIVKGHDVLPAERPGALLGFVVSLLIDSWIHDPLYRARLHQIYRAAFSLDDAKDAQVAQRLKAAFERGGLVALSRERAVVPEAPELTPDEVAPTRAAVAPPVLTWIEIELLDLEGHPIPNVPYELVLPDGTVRTGSLNVAGLARVDGIDPGTCKLSFPNSNLAIE